MRTVHRGVHAHRPVDRVRSTRIAQQAGMDPIPSAITQVTTNPHPHNLPPHPPLPPPPPPPPPQPERDCPPRPADHPGTGGPAVPPRTAATTQSSPTEHPPKKHTPTSNKKPTPPPPKSH